MWSNAGPGTQVKRIAASDVPRKSAKQIERAQRCCEEVWCCVQGPYIAEFTTKAEAAGSLEEQRRTEKMVVRTGNIIKNGVYAPKNVFAK